METFFNCIFHVVMTVDAIMNNMLKLRKSISSDKRVSIILAVFFVIITACTILQHPVIAVLQKQQQKQPTTGLSNTVILPSSISSSASSSSITDIFKEVEDSVVQVTSTIKSANPNINIIINGVPVSQNRTALASGFVFDKQGHIITNNHAVSNATKVDVTFVDGNTYSGNIIGKDPYSDIAVLQLTDNFSAERVLPLTIGNSSQLEVGQQVIAIGNPFGLSASVTTGIISQIGRLLPSPVGDYSIANGIQTDAAINPGNSGGPLLNMHGQVVGMTTAIVSSSGAYSGIGFAIPSSTIIKEVSSIIQKGTFTHPWLGFSGGKITPSLARATGLPPNYKGAMVASVQPYSPAAKAGLKGMIQDTKGITHLGDIITAIDGHPVRQVDDIINYMESNKTVGDNVKLGINRGGKIMDLAATLEARPAPGVESRPSQNPSLPDSRIPPSEIPQIPGLP